MLRNLRVSFKIFKKSPFFLLFHIVYADFPRFLYQYRFAHLRRDRPALLHGLAGANLLRLLFAFLDSHILALLLGERDALLLLLDSTDLLGDFLARLVTTLGQGKLNLLANFSTRLAHLLLNIPADLFGLIQADVLPNGSADLGFLLVALLVRLLAVLLQELADVTLPFLGVVLLGLGAHGLLDDFALVVLDLLADGLGGVVTLVLPDGLALGWGVALGLPLGHTVGAALLLKLDVAVRNGDFNTFVHLLDPALLLSGGMTNFDPDGLAVINHFILALVMVISTTNFVGDLIDDCRTLYLVIFFIMFVLFGKMRVRWCQ